MTDLQKALQLGDKPYHQGFNPSLYGDTLSAGSMPADGLYEYWMSEHKPSVVVEVGTFLGYSAIKMAKEVKRLGLPTKIICVDTWLGSAEHFNMHKKDGDMRLAYVAGYPTLYQKFISNVILHGVEDIIIPLPLPSTAAASVLRNVFTELNIQPEFMFIDGDHSALGVYYDLSHYYPLLKEGGVLWGDDWAWQSVREGVSEFLSDHDIADRFALLSNQVHWRLTK